MLSATIVQKAYSHQDISQIFYTSLFSIIKIFNQNFTCVVLQECCLLCIYDEYHICKYACMTNIISSHILAKYYVVFSLSKLLATIVQNMYSHPDMIFVKSFTPTFHYWDIYLSGDSFTMLQISHSCSHLICYQSIMWWWCRRGMSPHYHINTLPPDPPAS